MPTARRYVDTAVLDGKLYAAGGLNEVDSAISNAVERYDFATNAWEEVAPIAEVRDRHAVTVLDGKLYAVGGEGVEDEEDEEEEDDHPVKRVERFDPSTNAWEEVAPMVTARSAPWVALL